MKNLFKKMHKKKEELPFFETNEEREKMINSIGNWRLIEIESVEGNEIFVELSINEKVIIFEENKLHEESEISNIVFFEKRKDVFDSFNIEKNKEWDFKKGELLKILKNSEKTDEKVCYKRITYVRGNFGYTFNHKVIVNKDYMNDWKAKIREISRNDVTSGFYDN